MKQVSRRRGASLPRLEVQLQESDGTAEVIQQKAGGVAEVL